MSSEAVIRVEQLGKRYRLGELDHYRNLRGRLGRWLGWPIAAREDKTAATVHENGKPRNFGSQLWALRDVSFDVRAGETLGIIGANGAGKSTLLKILTRITAPTTGSGVIHGRVGSLLEVGTGFHPELTGRENIFLNGAILGMSRAEIRRKFDEIVDFSGVSQFIDTPIKRYSSGMAVRLAFAVAAHLEPEILIVDEVLAVGDAEFQRKCLGKMGDVAKEGRTVLFVSHNMQAVSTLCRRALYLDQGRLVMDDHAGTVVRQYLVGENPNELDRRWVDPQSAPGNQWIRLHRMRLLPDDGRDPRQIDVHTSFGIECWYWNLKPQTHLNLSLLLNNAEGVHVFVSTTIHEPQWHGRPFPPGLFRSVCHIPGDLLNDGMHRVEMYFVEDTTVPIFVCRDALSFDVHELGRESAWYGKWLGAVRPELKWTTELIEEKSLCCNSRAA